MTVTNPKYRITWAEHSARFGTFEYVLFVVKSSLSSSKLNGLLSTFSYIGKCATFPGRYNKSLSHKSRSLKVIRCAIVCGKNFNLFPERSKLIKAFSIPICGGRCVN